MPRSEDVAVGERRLRILGLTLLTASVVLQAAGLVLRSAARPLLAQPLPLHLPDILAFTSFVAVGALVVWRRPRNRIGWLLCAVGTVFAIDRFAESYGLHAIVNRGTGAGHGLALLWVSNWMWVLLLSGMATLLLLFPTGSLPSRRWRPVAWIGCVSAVAVLIRCWTEPGPLLDVLERADNPLSLGGGVGVVIGQAARYGFFGLMLSLLAGLVSLGVRYRRAGHIERQQIKWFFVGAAFFVLTFAASMLLTIPVAGAALANHALFITSIGSLPAFIGLAVLRYRLYDVDVLIDRAIVVAAVVGAVTAIYIAVVVGMGLAVERTMGSRVGLAVVATAISAVVFQPLRQRMERSAQRIVFGRGTEREREAGVAIRTLGAFRIVREGEVLAPTVWQSKKARTLLKVLVARRGRPVPREQLMDILWPGEDPASLGNRFSVALTTVRSVLDPGHDHPSDHHIVADRETVRLVVDALSVDVEDFLRTAEEGMRLVREGQAHDGRALLERAVELYTGDFLEEDPYEDWAAPLREEARAAYLAAARLLASDHAARANHERAVRLYLRALEADPWDQEAHLGLVHACDAAGWHGEARRHYRTYAARMHEIGALAAPYPARPAHAPAGS